MQKEYIKLLGEKQISQKPEMALSIRGAQANRSFFRINPYRCHI
jgi:hypothetical protein